jgi:hypothetical protein
VVLYLLAAGSCWISAQKLGLEDVGSIVIGIDPHPFAPIPKRKHMLSRAPRHIRLKMMRIMTGGPIMPPRLFGPDVATALRQWSADRHHFT